MNLKRAIILGGLVYVLSFILWMIIASLFGQEFGASVEPLSPVWYVGVVILILFMVSFTLWYFNDKSIKPSVKEGFLFGLITVVLGLVIDAVFTFSLMLFIDSPKNAFIYYINPLFWLTFVILVLTTTMVGKYEGTD